MIDEQEFLRFNAVLERILQRKVNYFNFENKEIMKLLMCLDCGDIFNLTKQEKKCGCGKTSGRYTDELNAEYEGNAQPIGFANGSFIEAIKVQRIENKKKKGKDECCKGVQFTAFFIPDAATSICKLD